MATQLAKPPKAGHPGKRTRSTRKPAEKKYFPIVGIGASAGGLEAMTQLLKHLPGAPGMAFVLVQHLDPTHESALTAILARSTPMPAVEAKHNMRMTANHLYVIPPNKLMGISGRRLKLSPRSDADPPLAIDSFLRSLADEEGNRAIGVILSGNGSDGTNGLLAIKAAGGITLAQDEKTAKYPTMPANAISSGCVDFVLPPDRIARELLRLAGHPYVVPSEVSQEAQPSADERSGTAILSILRQRMGVDFTHYKHATLQRRIQRRMVLHKIESLKDYVDFLRGHATEVKELYNDILIHVTGFFRDSSVFQALKKRIFPRLLKGKGADESLRIWIPGCSTGEEVYSLAIALIEFLNERRLHRTVQIFGTDINDSALEKARTGLYPEGIRGDLTVERLRRFFIKSEGGYRINKSVREMCIFARQNVVVDPPFSNIDLISCRNLLIYLGSPLQRKVIPLFHYALRLNGSLLLGASETIGSFSDLFALMDRKAKIYTKKATHFRPPVTFGHGIPEQPVVAGTQVASATDVAPSPAEVQRVADRVLLTHINPAGVVIDKNLEVLQFRGSTGAFLEHAQGDASLNLMKMAKEGTAIDLRSIVGKAMKQNTRIRQDRIRVRQDGGFRECSVEVIPFKVPPASERYYLVLFEDSAATTSPADKAEKGKKTRSKRGGPSREMLNLRDELSSTRESLQAIIEEQEATNEELRSANEEIMSSNEELQSTNEELETAKEELQSTNEELTTLNDELESRNVELEQLNNDMHNLLASVNLPVLILGPDLRIRRFTSVAERMFNLIPGDVGRPITDINLPLNVPNLPKLVMEVIDNLTTKELEVKCNRGRWYSVRIRPYKTTDNKIDGAVIAVLDVDLLKTGIQQIAQSRNIAESLVSTVRQPLAILSSDLTVELLNPAFCRTFSANLEKDLNVRIYEMANRQWDIPRLHTLLEEVLPLNSSCVDFEIEHDFKHIGHKLLRLNAARLPYDGEQKFTVVLSVEDATNESAGD